MVGEGGREGACGVGERGSMGHSPGGGGQGPLPSRSLWQLRAQVFWLHKLQHVRVQPEKLRFQLTNLFPWQEATFPCIFLKKRESERDCMRAIFLLSIYSGAWEKALKPVCMCNDLLG